MREVVPQKRNYQKNTKRHLEAFTNHDKASGKKRKKVRNQVSDSQKRAKRDKTLGKTKNSNQDRNNLNSVVHKKVNRPQSNKKRTRKRVSSATVSSKKSGNMVIALIGNILFYTITLGIIAMATMFSFSSKSSASIFGYRFYTVLTNSMVPQADSPKGGFYAGDIVIVQLMDGNKAEVGDIVTFSVGDGTRYLTHRVVEERNELNGEEGQFLVTKGDANETNDPPIPADRVVGKVVVALPKIGLILDFIREEFWACLICILSLYGSFLVLRAYLFSPNETKKSMNKKQRKKRVVQH